MSVHANENFFIKFPKVSGKFPIKVSRKFPGGEDIEGGHMVWVRT